MQIVEGPDEAVFPRNVGLMFFNHEPHRFFPGMQIDVVWFPDGPGGDTFTEKAFAGPLHVMVRDALDYVQRLYLDETVIKHPHRAESTRVANYPYAAVEEAIVNAVYHRSYEEREPVEVRIEPGQLAVLSYPGPDRSVKLDRLREGKAAARRYRNRRVGEFLKELDLTEGRGTGIPKIRKAMAANGSPEPVFEFDDDHSYFLVTLPVHPQADTSDLVLGGVVDEVPGEVRQLVRALSREMKRSELQDALGLKDRKHFRNSYLSPSIDLGLVEMTDPASPRSPFQRYRRTALGNQWLAEEE